MTNQRQLKKKTQNRLKRVTIQNTKKDDKMT